MISLAPSVSLAVRLSSQYCSNCCIVEPLFHEGFSCRKPFPRPKESLESYLADISLLAATTQKFRHSQAKLLFALSVDKARQQNHPGTRFNVGFLSKLVDAFGEVLRGLPVSSKLSQGCQSTLRNCAHSLRAAGGGPFCTQSSFSF